MSKDRGGSPFLESVREAIRVRHYSLFTERAYVHWIRRFILFHGKRHPERMGEAEVAAFLSHLAVQRKVAASTQNQALNALVFLYKAVLDRPLGDVTGVVRAKRPVRLPVVLSRTEVAALLSRLQGMYWLIGGLLYGSGLRLCEALSLRVKDINFEHRALLVRDGKAAKDRVVTLPVLWLCRCVVILKTGALCKSSLAIVICAPRKFTPMSCSGADWPFAVPWTD